MKIVFLLASAAMLATTAPLAAQGNSQGKGQSSKSEEKGKPNVSNRTSGNSAQARGRSNSNGGVIRTSNGRLYTLDARGSCPPGLAKRNNGCLPPGQAKKLYNVGQRYDRNFGSAWTYDQIPEYLRNQHTLNQADRYYYRSGYLYQVDPKTQLVQQVISALLR